MSGLGFGYFLTANALAKEIAHFFSWKEFLFFDFPRHDIGIAFNPFVSTQHTISDTNVSNVPMPKSCPLHLLGADRVLPGLAHRACSCRVLDLVNGRRCVLPRCCTIEMLTRHSFVSSSLLKHAFLSYYASLHFSSGWLLGLGNSGMPS